jgi:hypothetical protein
MDPQLINDLRESDQVLIFDSQEFCDFLFGEILTPQLQSAWDSRKRSLRGRAPERLVLYHETPTHFLMFVEFLNTKDDGTILLCANKAYHSRPEALGHFASFLKT